MSKTIDELHAEMNSYDSDKLKHLDDEYHYHLYLERTNMERRNPLSECCEAPISFSDELNENICTKCHELCKVI